MVKKWNDIRILDQQTATAYLAAKSENSDYISVCVGRMENSVFEKTLEMYVWQLVIYREVDSKGKARYVEYKETPNEVNILTEDGRFFTFDETPTPEELLKYYNEPLDFVDSRYNEGIATPEVIGQLNQSVGNNNYEVSVNTQPVGD